MPLETGTRLGAYEVVASIGAGGMGEVYRARDTRLKRDVAIKVLPDGFATDPDRLARFQREAELLASLNHPNIASIYGLEDGPAEAPAIPRARLGPIEDHFFNAACQFSTTVIGGDVVVSVCGLVMRRNRLPSGATS
jgi:Protein kinase domain